jgi:hypothetical protein
VKGVREKTTQILTCQERSDMAPNALSGQAILGSSAGTHIDVIFTSKKD